MGMLALTADERVTGLKFTKDTLNVCLRDGRTITVPLAWYPGLLNATAAERNNWCMAGDGVGKISFYCGMACRISAMMAVKQKARFSNPDRRKPILRNFW